MISLPRTMTVLVWAACVFASLPAVAHDLGVARVELCEKSGGHYELTATVTTHGPLPAGRPILPERCTFEAAPVILRRPGVANLQFRFTCRDRPLGPGDVLELPWGREGAFLSVTRLDGRTHSQFFGSERSIEGESRVRIPFSESWGQLDAPAPIARRYFLLGIEHILTGWDHLALVLCLCLIARGWCLLKLVTGFTLGHSLSLALAAFDVVRLPSPPTEACIALSIAFVAREALLPADSRRHGAGLIFVFGLLHGLGFAGAGRGRYWTGRIALGPGDVQSGRRGRPIAVRGLRAGDHGGGRLHPRPPVAPNRVRHESRNGCRLLDAPARGAGV